MGKALLIGTVKSWAVRWPRATPRPGVSNPHRYGQKEWLRGGEDRVAHVMFQTLIGTVKRPGEGVLEVPDDMEGFKPS